MPRSVQEILKEARELKAQQEAANESVAKPSTASAVAPATPPASLPPTEILRQRMEAAARQADAERAYLRASELFPTVDKMNPQQRKLLFERQQGGGPWRFVPAFLKRMIYDQTATMGNTLAQSFASPSRAWEGVAGTKLFSPGQNTLGMPGSWDDIRQNPSVLAQRMDPTQPLYGGITRLAGGTEPSYFWDAADFAAAPASAVGALARKAMLDRARRLAASKDKIYTNAVKDNEKTFSFLGDLSDKTSPSYQVAEHAKGIQRLGLIKERARQYPFGFNEVPMSARGKSSGIAKQEKTIKTNKTKADKAEINMNKAHKAGDESSFKKHWLAYHRAKNRQKEAKIFKGALEEANVPRWFSNKIAGVSPFTDILRKIVPSKLNKYLLDEPVIHEFDRIRPHFWSRKAPSIELLTEWFNPFPKSRRRARSRKKLEVDQSSEEAKLIALQNRIDAVKTGQGFAGQQESLAAKAVREGLEKARKPSGVPDEPTSRRDFYTKSESSDNSQQTLPGMEKKPFELTSYAEDFRPATQPPTPIDVSKHPDVMAWTRPREASADELKRLGTDLGAVTEEIKRIKDARLDLDKSRWTGKHVLGGLGLGALATPAAWGLIQWWRNRHGGGYLR